MKRTLWLPLIVGLLALASGPAFALTPTDTPDDTATPTETPTKTPTPVIRAAAGYGSSLALAVVHGEDSTQNFSYVTGDALALWTGEHINLVKVPKGAIITDIYIYMPDVDSGTTLTFDLGLASNTDAFFTASTLGQAGGIAASVDNAANGLVAGAFPAAALTADDVVVLTVTAPAEGAGAGGTIKGWVRYEMHAQGTF